MQLTLNIGFSQISHLVSQLPANQIAKIKYEISDIGISEKARKEILVFQKFLLTAPSMSDEQYFNFQQQREHFNQWRAQ